MQISRKKLYVSLPIRVYMCSYVCVCLRIFTYFNFCMQKCIDFLNMEINRGCIEYKIGHAQITRMYSIELYTFFSPIFVFIIKSSCTCLRCYFQFPIQWIFMFFSLIFLAWLSRMMNVSYVRMYFLPWEVFFWEMMMKSFEEKNGLELV